MFENWSFLLVQVRGLDSALKFSSPVLFSLADGENGFEVSRFDSS